MARNMGGEVGGRGQIMQSLIGPVGGFGTLL